MSVSGTTEYLPPINDVIPLCKGTFCIDKKFSEGQQLYNLLRGFGRGEITFSSPNGFITTISGLRFDRKKKKYTFHPPNRPEDLVELSSSEFLRKFNNGSL